MEFYARIGTDGAQVTARLGGAVSAQYAQVTAGIAALEDVGKSAAER